MAVLTAQRGLVTLSSELSRPDGAMVVADNVVIDADNTVQQRRGFKEYSQEFPSPIKQLMTYKNRLIAHYETTLSVDALNSGTFSNFTGDFSELVQGLRLKYIEANGNLYFTTSNGIKKLSVKDASGLATVSVTDAGGIKAIDLSGKVIPDSSGFLPPESKVSYKIMFGTKDASGNVIYGVPSSRAILTNASKAVEQSEIFTINVFNYASLTDGAYFLFSVKDKGYFVWFKKTNTGTAPINADTIDKEGIEVDIQTATNNNEAAAMLANAMSTVAGQDITVELSLAELEVKVIAPGDVSDVAQGSIASSVLSVTKIFDGSITDGTSAKAELTFAIPEKVTTDYFYQLYRTHIETVSAGVSLNDLDPGDEHQFVYEAPVTAADITAGEITVQDNTPDTFRASGAYLYTNAVNGQGILQANERPPIAHDIASFRNSTFYANTKDVHRLTFSLLSVDNFVSGNTKFYIGQGGKSTHYTFVGEKEVSTVQVIAKSTTLGNSYFTLNAANDDRSYYFWMDKGTLSQTFNSTTAVAANTITINNHGLATNDAIKFSGVVPGGLTVGTIYYAIRINANTISVSATTGGSAIALTDAVGDAIISHVPQDPAVPSKLGVRIPLELYDDTVQGSTNAIVDAILALSDFEVEDLGSGLVQVTCTDSGNVSAPTHSTLPSGWTTSVVIEGDGEDTVAKETLLSLSTSTAISIDLTARSLVKNINRDPDSPVIASYLSGQDDLPGKILLEAKALEDINFYVAISDPSLTMEFSPELPVRYDLVSVDDVTGVFSTNTHPFAPGDEIYLHDNPGSSPVEFGGAYTIDTVPNNTSFTLKNVDVAITQTGPLSGNIFLTKAASDNNKAPNRIYYSKTLQPESVPIPNYIDVGSKDKPILRILALRDNLFVLKEDGIYIVTGQSAPNFSVRLLDNSAILIAPDTAVVLNNLIYCLTTQGAVTISETGVSIISRPIENLIKQVTTFAFNYKYSSFGVAYESDRSYLLWVPTIVPNVQATQCFRYNSITNTWTRWVKTNTCGLINLLDDRMYLGGGVRKFIEQERKNNERQDYADRDFTRTINSGAFISDTELAISSVVDVEAGDVITQEQYLTVKKFNRLLKMIDKDNGASLSNYYTDLLAAKGDNLSNKLQSLVVKLNSDAGLYASFSTPSGVNTIQALKADFNLIIDELNDPLSGTSLKSYKKAEDLLTYEVLITDVVASANKVSLNFIVPFIQGNVQVYKAIKSEVQWAPQHFGKPEALKQVHEGTLIFDQGTIYSGIVSYSSDRSADFIDIPFELGGPGFWASYNWADSVWGGGGRDAPIRTLVPVNKSRCRYINVKFKHQNAREAYKLVGISLEPREVSTRGYR